MKDQINTIREALTAALSDDQPYIEACKQALDAVDQIEAMVGEQKPICWAESDGEGGILWDQDSCFSNDPAWFDSPMPLYAAPVAQQPQAEAVPPGFVAFARDVLADFPHGFPDDFDLNDLAIKHGLLIGKTVTERCGELCNCAEYHGEDELKGGVTCYHRHAAIAAQGAKT